MKTIIAVLVVAASLMTLTTSADAHGRHKVCVTHHHHRVCTWK